MLTHIHNTGTNVPPNDLFLPTSHCMEHHRNKISQTFVAFLLILDTTHLHCSLLESTSHNKENWLTSVIACQYLLAKKQKNVKRLNGGQNSESCQFRFASDKPEEKEQQTCTLLSSSQLLNLVLGVLFSPFYHVFRSLKVQNQHNCGIWQKYHVENKKKILLGKRTSKILKLCL